MARSAGRFLRSLHDRDRVRVVCIDLWNGYRALIRRWFPQAKIVADRFQAIRLVGLHLFKLARSRGIAGAVFARGPVPTSGGPCSTASFRLK